MDDRARPSVRSARVEPVGQALHDDTALVGHDESFGRSGHRLLDGFPLEHQAGCLLGALRAAPRGDDRCSPPQLAYTPFVAGTAWLTPAASTPRKRPSSGLLPRW